MQTSAAVENASLFEIDQNRRPYQFYLGWYLKGMSIFVVLDGALAKLAVDSRFHRGMFIAAGAASTLVLLAPIAVSFTFERRTSNTLGRLAELTALIRSARLPFGSCCSRLPCSGSRWWPCGWGSGSNGYETHPQPTGRSTGRRIDGGRADGVVRPRTGRQRRP